MKKLFATALLSLAALSVPSGNAQAGLFDWLGCCCHERCCICVRPYNAFTPAAFGSITADGCCPVQWNCGNGRCGPQGPNWAGSDGCGLGQLPGNVVPGPMAPGPVLAPDAPRPVNPAPMPQPRAGMMPYGNPYNTGYQPMYYPAYPQMQPGYGVPYGYGAYPNQGR